MRGDVGIPERDASPYHASRKSKKERTDIGGASARVLDTGRITDMVVESGDERGVERRDGVGWAGEAGMVGGWERKGTAQLADGRRTRISYGMGSRGVLKKTSWPIGVLHHSLHAESLRAGS